MYYRFFIRIILETYRCNIIMHYAIRIYSLKKIEKLLDIPHLHLTTYVPRHAWASIARENGVSLSVISEGMGHTSEKTTRIYLASLSQVVMDEANHKVLSSI